MTPLVYGHLGVKLSWPEQVCIVYVATGVRHLGVKKSWPQQECIVYEVTGVRHLGVKMSWPQQETLSMRSLVYVTLV